MERHRVRDRGPARLPHLLGAVCGRPLTSYARGATHNLIHIKWCKSVRTNIELDPDLVREAQQLGGIKTKRALVHQALVEYVAHRKRLDLRELEGADLLDPEYDHKVSRAAAN